MTVSLREDGEKEPEAPLKQMQERQRAKVCLKHILWPPESTLASLPFQPDASLFPHLEHEGDSSRSPTSFKDPRTERLTEAPSEDSGTFPAVLLVAMTPESCDLTVA